MNKIYTNYFMRIAFELIIKLYTLNVEEERIQPQIIRASWSK